MQALHERPVSSSRRDKQRLDDIVEAIQRITSYYEEALENIKNAIGLHVEDRIVAGEEIPQP